MMLGVDKDGHPRVLAIEPKDIPVCKVVYRSIANKCSRIKYHNLAKEYMDQAFGLDSEDWRTVWMRACCAMRAARYEDALEDANMALDNDIDDMDALLVKARALYNLGEFEKALMMAHRGWKRRKTPPDFAEVIFVSEETIEDCIGRNVGPIMLEFLDIIYDMEKERVEEELRASQLREDPCNFPEDEEESGVLGGSVAQQICRARLESYMACKYLGRLCRDRDFFLRINDSTILEGPKKTVTEVLMEYIGEGIEMLKRKQETLRERMPLYSIRYRESICSPTVRKRKRQSTEKMREIIRNTALSMLERMRMSRIQKDFKVFYQTVERAYEFIQNKPSTLLERKRAFLEGLFNLAGVGYLDMMTINKDDPDELKILQAKMHMGIPTPNGPAVDAVLANTVRPCVDYKKRSHQSDLRLAVAESHLERAWLYADMSYNSGEARRFDLARHFGRKCVTEGRTVEHWSWCIIADLCIAKSEMRQHNVIEAMQAIQEAMEFAQRMKSESVMDLLVLCTEVIQNAPAEVIEDPRKRREQSMVELMVTDELEAEAKMLLQAIREREMARAARKSEEKKRRHKIDFSHLAGAHAELENRLEHHDAGEE